MEQDDSGVDVGAQPAKADRPSRPWIRYRTEYRNRITKELLASRETETLPVPETADEAIDEPVFELVTMYYTRLLESSRPSETSKPEGGPRLVTTPLIKPRYCLNIFSRAIANALQSVVKYYPSQPLTADPIVVEWPYPVLVHHYDELTAFRDTAATKNPQEMCTMERDADKHLTLLLRFLDDHVMDGVRAEQERNKRGLYTWEYTWLLYKPGATILERLKGKDQWDVTVQYGIEGGIFEDSPLWYISQWSMVYDGRFLGRKKRTVCLPRSEELEDQRYVLDTTGIDDDNTGNLPEPFQQHIKYGKQYWELLRKQCKKHKGKSRDFPYNEIEGLVMVDLKSYSQDTNAVSGMRQQSTSLLEKLMSNDDCRPSFVDGTCAYCRGLENKRHEGGQGLAGLFEDYNCIDLEDKVDGISNHQYMLCPGEIKAFVFKTRKWETVHVRNLSEPEFDEEMINGLVMDNGRKITLMSLAKSFSRQNKLGKDIPKGMWAADLVRGKGSGLIFLLHGRPGVGKTCTAECIAAFTRRPLMVITSSDIGTRPDYVETNLTRVFKTAVSWDAVLLIDEADVFMERRSSTDLDRNSLVAGFLRALEHYDGILFLTTNRVGAFDDAFISRIHVQLFYPEFTDEQRQLVWKTFMDKLARERGNYMRLNIDAKEYIRGAEMRSVQWNGREIRNALQTAAALAEFNDKRDEEGKIIITDAHLKAVVELSADFKTYLNDLHRGDELKRAERKYERLDDRLRAPAKP